MIPDIIVKEPAEGQFIAGWMAPGGFLGCEHEDFATRHNNPYQALACAIGRLAGSGYPEDPYGVVPYASRPRQERVSQPGIRFSPDLRPTHQPRHARPPGGSLKPDQIGHHRLLAAERLNIITPGGSDEL